MKKYIIAQVKSSIGLPKTQKRTLEALGLKKLNRRVEHNATPQIEGMINAVRHLLSVEVVND
ncbi:MAG TPA: 50S ribosomal protein L30 [Bacteroidales bacterium]|nr:50S ribosomal protein L30 [Bacteroidales bacterium]